MKTSSSRDDKIKLRNKIAEYADKHGVSEAARKFGTTRKTVRKWLVRYQNDEDMTNLSRKGQKCPHKVPEKVEKLIIETRRKNPNWGAEKIKEELNLPYSSTTIYNKIFKHNLISKRLEKDLMLQKIKSKLDQVKPFGIIFLNVKKITGILRKYNLLQYDFPEYQLSAVDLKTGMMYIAYSYERTNLSTSIFVDYICSSLEENNVNVKESVFFTSNGKEFSSSSRGNLSLFEEIIKVKYSANFYQDFQIKDIFDYVINQKNSILSKEFYKNLKIDSTKQLLYRTYSFLIHHNNFRTDYKDEIPVQVIENDENLLKGVSTITPVIVDKYISDIVSIRTKKNYWTFSVKDKEQITETTIDHYRREGHKAKESFDSLTALDYYDKILKISGDNLKLQIETLFKKSDLLQLLGNWNDNELLLEELIKLANKYGDDLIISDAYVKMGWHYHMKGQLRKAEGNYSVASNILSKVKDRKRQSLILSYLGKIELDEGYHDKALENFQKQLKMAEELKDEELLINANYNVCLAYHSKGQSGKALEYLQKNIPLLEQSNRIEQLFHLYEKLGMLYHNLAQYDKVLVNYQKALRFAYKLGAKRRIAITVAAIGLFNRSLGNFTQAINNFEESYEAFEEIGSIGDMSNALSHLGNCYNRLGKIKEGLNYYNRAIELDIKTENTFKLMQNYVNKAKALKRLKKYKEAEEVLKKLDEHTLSKSHEKLLVEKTILSEDIKFEKCNSRFCKLKNIVRIKDLLNLVKKSSDKAYLYFVLWVMMMKYYNFVLTKFKKNEWSETVNEFREKSLSMYKKMYKVRPLHEIKEKIDILENEDITIKNIEKKGIFEKVSF